MILPKKHLSVQESFIGFGGFLLSHLCQPMDVDSLWDTYKDAYSDLRYPVKFSFDEFIVTLDFLYMIGAIKSEKGVLYEVN
mgnify:CR=1 FL=1